MSVLQEAGHVKNKVVLHLCLLDALFYIYLMHSEVAWILVSSGTQVQPQIVIDPGHFADYLSVSYDYGTWEKVMC